MKLSTTNNVAEAEAALDAQLAAIRERALPRIVNTLSDQAETAGFRKIHELYQIPARTMQQYASTQYAIASSFEATLTVKGKGFSLSAFKPVETANGVAVTIKGKRIVIPHSFMVQRFGRNVFARGAYGGKGLSRPTGQSFGRFQFDRGGLGSRHGLPINQLNTFAPPDCLSNPEVRATMDARVDEQGPKVAAREIAAVRRGF